MRRRSFVGAAFAGLALNSGAKAKDVKPGDIPKITLGKTGEKLTRIGQAGGKFRLISFEEAKAVTLRAYELGINYFDNARSYWEGRAEEVFGAVLPPFRKELFLTSKTTQRTRKGADEELHASLKALNTDYLDLWQIHAVNSNEDLEKIFAPGGAIEAFEAAKKAGKVRFIGFTGHHDPSAHRKMLELYDGYDTILMPLNPADPSYLSFEKQVLPEAVKRGLGIQAMKTLVNGQLTHLLSIKECLHYVLSLPIHCAPLGANSVGQIEDDVRIVQQFKPYSEETMAAFREKAKDWAGPRLEFWKRNIETAANRNTVPEYLGG